MQPTKPAGHYGLDAPWVPWLLAGIGIVYFVLAACAAWLWDSPGTAVVIGIVAIGMFCSAALFWHASLRGKFAVWSELLGQQPAPDRMLDMGCGRGAIAIMAALRFPRARIDGVDLWRRIDQSGNGMDAASANARGNGVDGRITWTTADMTALPYPDAAFDLVTASVSIHNIPTAKGRADAIEQAWRVLRPGGRIVIGDIAKTREYESRLGALGAANLSARPAGWRMWWGGPWMATRIVQAAKPV